MTSSTSFAALDRFVAALEHRTQAAIAQAVPDAPPTIRCRFQQGRLLALSEDTQAAATSIERDQRFKALALALSTELAEIELPEAVLNTNGELPVRLYLRERGTASPYAARSWDWQPTNVAPDLFDPPDSADAADSADEVDEVGTGALVLVSSSTNDDIPSQEDEAVPFPQTSSLATRWHSVAERARLQERWQAVADTCQDLPWRSIGGLMAVGITVGAIAYGISRPCLIGSCGRRQTASDLSQSALAQLEGTPRPDEVSDAYRDLQKATRLVGAIPPWSSHYDSAQGELVRYRTQLADLEWIIAAQKSATLASEKGQDPPHSVPIWVDVHLLWQKAVNHLQRVPEDSPVAPLAQQKLAEYEANYAAIGQRLSTEEQAEANLNKAMQAGQLATTEAENATTLTDWLSAQRQWDRALQALGKIPKGTLAYEEARSLLPDYRSESVQTRTRTTFEKAGERAYQGALAKAAQAQAAESRNQWTLAVNNWSDAYAQMRQVPKNTIRYAEAQSTLDDYQTSLKQAQSKLRQAVALQTIEDDLAELCPISAGMCTYSVGPQQIELILREPYDSAIRQSISPPSDQGSLPRTNSVIEETHQLVQNIMQLGNQVQLPIALYDVDRGFIARYKPEYGGFVKR